MTLAELVAGKTLAQARAYLDELVTVANPERINVAALMARLTNDESGEVFATLHAEAASNPLVSEALIQLRGEGLDLSHANAKAMIDALFTGELAIKLKALGEKQVTRAEANGLGRVKDGHILEVL